VRWDGGVETGDEITLFYDSLLGKLIVWAPTRPAAIERMRRALDELVLTGVATNQGFHRRLMADPAFQAGEIDIQFLNRLLLRYEGRIAVASTPTGQVSGFGDAQISAIGMLSATPRFVAVVIGGVILDSASQPPLGEGKTQLVFGGGAAMKPFRWWLPYVLVQEQVSVGGDSARPDINQLVARVGNIVFGPGYAWLKLDLDTLVDFETSAGSFYGKLEAGRLLVGRVGLFIRAGTQLLGTRQVDYTLEVGIRYLFRLAKR
jgi:hypothetical protein